MTEVHPLYEPKLVERWAKQYAEFETDELTRRLREAKAKLEVPEKP